MHVTPFTMNILALLTAVFLAAAGGETFLKGVLGFAAWLRLPKMLVATTLAAFATSSPELTVSTLAAISGKPEIGLGDALGSNVTNIALILGIALLFGALPARLEEIKRDMILALAVPILTLLLASDGIVSRADGVLLLTLFAFWMGLMIRQGVHHRKTAPSDLPTCKPIYAWLFVLAGLACLILAGKLFVSGASGIAAALGMHPYAIGATIVAVGTSLPELVTTLLSRWRGHEDIGLGTVLGSNLFNGLTIVGVASTICPIEAPFREVAIALGFGVLAILLILPRRGKITCQRGVVLLVVYAAYLTITLAYS